MGGALCLEVSKELPGTGRTDRAGEIPKRRTEIYDLTIGDSFELKIKDFLNKWAMGKTGYL